MDYKILIANNTIWLHKCWVTFDFNSIWYHKHLYNKKQILLSGWD